jgi:hypothetical protein
MTDLFQQVGRLAADYLNGEAGQKAIAAAVGKCVESAIQSATSYGSDFSKALHKVVAGKLRVPEEIELPEYHDHIAKVVLAVVRSGMDKAIAVQVESRLKEFIEPIPAATSLSEIAKRFRDECTKNYEAGGGGDDEITIRADRDHVGFVHLLLDPKSKADKYKCKIDVGVYKGTIYSLRFEDKNIEKEMFVGPLYGFERYLFQLRASAVRIEEDIEAVRDVNTYIASV